MVAQGNALGFGIDGCALQGRRNPSALAGRKRYLGHVPGALPRAGMLRALGASTWLSSRPEKTAMKRFRRHLLVTGQKSPHAEPDRGARLHQVRFSSPVTNHKSPFTCVRGKPVTNH
jgi:hypothetical protein